MEYACFDPAGDYGDWDEVYGDYEARQEIAKERWTCDECDSVMNVGDEYEYASGILSGELHEHRTCKDCLSIAEAFFCSRMHGGLFDDLEDYLEDYNPEDDCYAKAVLKLTDVARKKVQEIFERVIADREE
jgi:hypothetical protein